ncbi:MAG: zinc ribbon domain-containing protein [Desulfurococcales archaeon]|nr:zinc ribbon domain-containing protein [Desulfurococcales archaeon]
MSSGEAKSIDFFIPILDFLGSLDGVDEAVLVSEEGFPVEFRKVDKKTAEVTAALAVDYTISTSSILKEALGKPPEGVVIDVDGKRIINIKKIQDLILVVRGDRSAVEAGLKPVELKLAGKQIRCANCGEDLTLATYKCPKCGKTIPFTADTCPHCSANLHVKRCPKCGALITSTGNLVVRRKSKTSSILASIEGGIAGVGFGAAALLFSGSPLVGGLVGSVTGALVGFLVYRAMPEEEVELSSH